jgi:hypothetical protein
MTVATRKLHGPEQNLEFVARTLLEGDSRHQDINPLSMVGRGLDNMTLTLAPLADPRNFRTTDDGKEAYIRWAVSFYVYAVVAQPLNRGFPLCGSRVR